jgi:hypothetical protein
MNGTATPATPSTTMKVIDKIATYQEKQKQPPTEQIPKLPALSLEFFPPKTQEGVVVSTRCVNTWLLLYFYYE